jgi:oligosaccharide repeat unit polymerase
MDVWHFSLALNVFTIHVMLPFSRSNLNIIALGPILLAKAQQHVNESYFISAFGYFWLLVGGNLWRVHLGLNLRKRASQWLEYPTKGSLLLLQSGRLLLLHGLLASLILAGVLAYYFRASGFGFNLRGLLLVRPQLRPIAQFGAFYSVLMCSYCLARFYLYRELFLLLPISMMLTELLFFGERANFLGIATLPIMGLFIIKGRKIKLTTIATGFLLGLSFAMVMDALRGGGGFSVARVLGGFGFNIFFGNSFSDTRDFALVLGYWDRHFLLGKTYLAALMAFIPRVLSSFRDQWSYGVVTASIVGFDPKEHPGLRIGIFGEAYINFGLPAVLLLGLFVGAVQRLIDLRMKQCALIYPNSDPRIYSYLAMGMLIGVAEISGGASQFYSIILIFIASWVTIEIAKFLEITV